MAFLALSSIHHILVGSIVFLLLKFFQLSSIRFSLPKREEEDNFIKGQGEDYRIEKYCSNS
jgi:hypothetical protein